VQVLLDITPHVPGQSDEARNEEAFMTAYRELRQDTTRFLEFADALTQNNITSVGLLARNPILHLHRMLRTELQPVKGSESTEGNSIAQETSESPDSNQSPRIHVSFDDRLLERQKNPPPESMFAEVKDRAQALIDGGSYTDYNYAYAAAYNGLTPSEKDQWKEEKRQLKAEWKEEKRQLKAEWKEEERQLKAEQEEEAARLASSSSSDEEIPVWVAEPEDDELASGSSDEELLARAIQRLGIEGGGRLTVPDLNSQDEDITPRNSPERR
jgi:cell division septum initiation protein DivIVA